MSIKTFEELFEEVKKLYPDINNSTYGKYGSGFLFWVLNQEMEVNFRNDADNSYLLFALAENDGCLLLANTKDPNKILKVIKALKECEDE
jgi:hypothetical protein